jgi:hypothetical protein
MIALSHMLLIAAVGLVMVLAGLGKQALERPPRRICPSCGRNILVCHCR